MPLSDDLLTPIDGSNPAGVDVRYESVYDEIKEARREDDDVPQGDWETTRKTADSAKVIKLATDVLEKQSKDLQVAAWLTEATLRREGIPGVHEGVALVRAMTETFWDNAYPEIEKDDDEPLALRVAPLRWLDTGLAYPIQLAPINSKGHTFLEFQEAKKIGYEADAEETAQKEARAAFVAAERPTLEDFDDGFDATPKAWYKQLMAALDGTLAELDAIEAFCEAKFAEFGHKKDDAPGYGGMRKSLDEFKRAAQQLLDKKLVEDPDPEVPEEDVDVGGGMSAGGDATSLPVEPTSVQDAADRVAAAARYLQRADPTNPASYLMLRGFRWGELRALGGGIDPKMLAAPPTQRRTKLRSLLLDQKWSELLTAGESVMATPFGRGWLDLQRYILTACENLGHEYDPVASAVRGALAALLRDLPELPQQTLMDDTPTANRETLVWLSESISAEALTDIPMPGAVEQGAGSSDGGGGVTVSSASRTVWDRAMVHVRSGNPQRGIELLMQEAEQEKSVRDRFLRKAEAAEIMVEHGLEVIALPTLRRLAEQIETHQLENWEAGEIVARPMALLFRALKRTEGESEATQTLYQRVARLDPMQAMAAMKEPAPSQSQGEDG